MNNSSGGVAAHSYLVYLLIQREKEKEKEKERKGKGDGEGAVLFVSNIGILMHDALEQLGLLSIKKSTYPQ